MIEPRVIERWESFHLTRDAEPHHMVLWVNEKLHTGWTRQRPATSEEMKRYYYHKVLESCGGRVSPLNLVIIGWLRWQLGLE